jgi:hypothetical protein
MVELDHEFSNGKLRIRCARCRTVNAAVEVPGVEYGSAFKRPG